MNYKFILFSLVILCLYQNIDAQRLESSDCKCRLPANRRIVGGREVKQYVPWMVSLGYWSAKTKSFNHFCGGTIINRKWILTAAHCFQVLQMGSIEKIQVRVGMTELNQTKNVQRFTAKSFRMHSGFHLGWEPDQYGDIGFIEIDGNIQFSETVQPACFPANNEYESYADRIGSLHAVGFGYINSFLIDNRDGSKSPTKLTNRLKEAFFNDQSATKTGCHSYLICIIQLKYPDSTCSGDSGGGLMHHTKNGLTRIVGINSFGWNKRENKNDPYHVRTCVGESAFSRITEYIRLFESVVNNDYCTVTINWQYY